MKRPPTDVFYLAVIAGGLLALAVSCARADVLPDAIDAELDHVSHASQHFGPHSTEYGYNAAALVARWYLTPRVTLAVTEGAVLDRRDGASYGGLWGPRELFQARLSYTLWRKTP